MANLDNEQISKYGKRGNNQGCKERKIKKAMVDRLPDGLKMAMP